VSNLPRLVLPPPARERVAIAGSLIAIGLSIQGLWAGIERLWTIYKERRT
jgi:hypothetical protein